MDQLIHFPPLFSRQNSNSVSLGQAASAGDLAKVHEFLLMPSVNVDEEDQYGRTPLMLAAIGGHLEVMRALLEQGANVNARNLLGSSPLSVAAESGHLDIVNLLLTHSTAPQLDAQDQRGLTALMHVITGAHLAVVKRLLRVEPRPTATLLNTQDFQGRSAFFYACDLGDVDMVRTLLEHISDGLDLNLANNDGETPFLVSIGRRNNSVAHLLLSLEPNIRPRLDTRSERGCTTLMHACEYDDIELVDALLSLLPHAWIDLQAKDGWTALQMACAEGHANVVERLLRHEPPPNPDLINRAGQTALMCACTNDAHIEVVRLLLYSRRPPDLEIVNKAGLTALQLACGVGTSGPAASERKAPLIGMMLLERLYGGWLTRLLGDNQRALEAIARKPTSEAANVIKSILEERPGVDLNQSDAQGCTPLMSAAQAGNLHLVKMLLAHQHLDVDLMDVEGRTALHYARASRRQHSEEVATLLEKVATERALQEKLSESRLRFRSNVRLLELIGAGNSGTVYKVTIAPSPDPNVEVDVSQLSSHEVFAVKFMRPGHPFDELLAERAAMNSLDHPNVVRFVCLMSDDLELDPRKQSHGLVLPYMSGGSLGTYVRQQPCPIINEMTFLPLALDMARGLQYLHNRQPTPIVHRDIALRNFLLDAHGRALISDFGLARKTNQLHMVHSDTVALPSCAPELLRNNVPTTHSDVWMLGLVYLQMLRAGDFPLSDNEQLQWVDLVESGLLPNLLQSRIPQTFASSSDPPTSSSPHHLQPPMPSPVPSWLHRLIVRCLQADPLARPSMDDIVRKLEMNLQAQESASILLLPSTRSRSRSTSNTPISVPFSLQHRDSSINNAGISKRDYFSSSPSPMLQHVGSSSISFASPSQRHHSSTSTLTVSAFTPIQINAPEISIPSPPQLSRALSTSHQYDLIVSPPSSESTPTPPSSSVNPTSSSSSTNTSKPIIENQDISRADLLLRQLDLERAQHAQCRQALAQVQRDLEQMRARVQQLESQLKL